MAAVALAIYESGLELKSELQQLPSPPTSALYSNSREGAFSPMLNGPGGGGGEGNLILVFRKYSN